MINQPETLDPKQDYKTEAEKPAATDLPLSPGKVLLDLNADRVIDVLAARRLSDDPGNCTTQQQANDYFRTAVNRLLSVRRNIAEPHQGCRSACSGV